MLPAEEQEALKFLSKLSDGIVLTYPFDKGKADAAVTNPPRPLYLYESTAYVSAFSKKPVFLEDQINLDITGYSWQKRRVEVENFYDKPTTEFLAKNNISYLYLVKDQTSGINPEPPALKKVFENTSAIVYEVEE